ncbi:MAG: CdaR family protein [Eubacteriales bacterium]|nr:CdaR family protein [Eubacteriales bacterium]
MEKSSKNSRMTKMAANFKTWFNQRWGLALMSLVFAVLVWNLVITEANPQRQLTIAAVPVSIQGMDKLTNQGLTVKGQTGASSETVTLKVEMARSEMLRSTNTDVTAYLDLSGINAPGTYDAPVKAVSSRGTVSSISPQTMKIVVEELGSKLVAVKTNLVGELAQGMWHSDPALSSNQIRISGAQSEVSLVDHAQVSVDVTQMSGQASATCEFEFLDADGKLLDASAFQSEVPNCVVRMDVYPEKVMTVSADEFLISTLKDGYEVSSIAIYPSELHLVGYQEKLDAVQKLQLTPMSVQGADTDQTFTAKVQLPEGVISLEGEELVVIVRIAPKVIDTVYENAAVEVRNVPSGLKVGGTVAAVNVTLEAEQNFSRLFHVGKLALFVDATGLEAGTHTLTIKTDITGGMDEVKRVIIEPASITVRLDRK